MLRMTAVALAVLLGCSSEDMPQAQSRNPPGGGSFELTGDAAAALISGSFDIEVSMRMRVDTGDASAFYAFAATTAQGEVSLRWARPQQKWILRVNGADVLSTNPFPSQNVGGAATFAARAWDEVRASAWYSPGGEMGIRVGVGGVYGYDTLGVAGADAGTATALYAGALPRATFFAAADASAFALVTGLGHRSPHVIHGVAIGDSITAHRIGSASEGVTVGAYNGVLANDDIATGVRVGMLAIGGAKISDQLAAWQASEWRGRASLRWVSIQVGLNDLTTRTAEQMVADTQAVVDDIASVNPAARIILVCLTPADGYFLDPGQRAKRVALNAAIMDGTITGAHERVDAHLETLGADGVLHAAFDVGDGLHVNNSGASFNASAIRAALRDAGILSP